ncbi:VWA domain-containing protein [Paenibacillus sp. SN-8-1]|uniref:VWA domain-containing protein n=1 Tax=Paenibacillus sp. SN-8-1 TaxID=3435409 RepID=UPI003D9A4B8C
MYCTNCGKKLNSNILFCGECGQQVIQSEPRSVEEQDSNTSPIGGNGIVIDVLSEERQDSLNTGNRTTSKRTYPKWVMISAAALVLIGGVSGVWYWNSSKGPSDVQVVNTAKQNSNNAPSTSESPKESTSEPTEKPMNVKLEPAFIQVNQVDSSNYENGQVDVYFSLFADDAFSVALDSENLTREMFKVNGSPVTQVSKVNEIDPVSVNLVIDKSGSMMDPPNEMTEQSKIDLVRSAAIQFLHNVPSNSRGQFELLTFSSFAPDAADIPFNSNRQYITSYLSTLESDNGKTALYDSLTKALYDTNLQDGPKYIIAFTDGENTEVSDYGSSAQSVIDLSKQLGIPIYTIGFGGTSTDLQWISDETGGSYFSIDEQDDLQSELQNIYQNVFQKYVKQYKLTFKPAQTIDPGGDFPITVEMNSNTHTAKTSTLEYTRKIDTESIQVMNGLFEYQVNYANAVNNLDFSLVSDNVMSNSNFYQNLKNRIEIDYVNLRNEGTPKIIDPLENYRTVSIEPQPDGSYKVKFFKLFPLELNQERVYEADLNSYTLIQDPESSKWKVGDFGRSECSIYKNESDPGSTCKSVNGTSALYSGDPWPKN